MNLRQKLVLLVGGLCALVVGLYPPWVHTFGSQRSGTRYSPLWRPLGPHDRLYGLQIDWNRLGLELLLLALVTGGLVVLFDGRDESV